jgi:hypothetical protein
MNLLIQIVLVLVIAGLVWGLITYIPDRFMPATFKQVIYVIIIIALVLYFANLLFHFAPL